MAGKTAKSTHDMMEKLIKQASEMNLGPSCNPILTSSSHSGPGKRKSRSVGSGRYSETSGALHSDDDFSSIGYSFEAQDPVRISDPPRSGNGAG